MFRTVIISAAAGLALTTSVFAAEGWGIDHEKVTRTEAKVVDLLCEIAGNCLPNCGNGKRQLGLLLDSGKLVPVVKNNDPFAGAVTELKSFCNKRIIADGLMISNPKMSIFQLQFFRSAPKGKPKGKWNGAKWFTRNWAKDNPGKDARRWFENDPLIRELVAKDGVLGIPGLKPPK